MNKSPVMDKHFIAGVEQRLETLRKICLLESVEEGRARLAADRSVNQEPFVVAVERRLRELRALMELTQNLHSLSTTHFKP